MIGPAKESQHPSQTSFECLCRLASSGKWPRATEGNRHTLSSTHPTEDYVNTYCKSMLFQQTAGSEVSYTACVADVQCTGSLPAKGEGLKLTTRCYRPKQVLQQTALHFTQQEQPGLAVHSTSYIFHNMYGTACNTATCVSAVVIGISHTLAMHASL